MRELALLGVAIILGFIAFVIFWNRKWRGKVLDEREANLRLKVRMMIARAVEIALVAGIGFHFIVRPLSGLEAFLVIGLAGISAEAYGNWYLHKDDVAETNDV